MKRTTKFTVLTTVIATLAGGAAFAKHHGDKGPRAERMFERMDADKDGKVTAAEAVALATERFARRDMDGDGIVSREDRKAKRIERRAERFAKIDADSDGMISMDEFTAFTPERREKRRGNRAGRRAPLTIQEAEARALRRFERIDVAEKGFITLEDVKAHRKNRRHRH